MTVACAFYTFVCVCTCALYLRLCFAFMHIMLRVHARVRVVRVCFAYLVCVFHAPGIFVRELDVRACVCIVRSLILCVCMCA